MIVVDASAALEVLLWTPAAAAVEKRLFEPGAALCAPHLIDLEVAQVVRRYALSGEITPIRGEQALADFAGFPIARYPHDVLLPRIWQLRENLTAYDAAYVALAETLNMPLLTRDRKLAASTGHRARIETV